MKRFLAIAGSLLFILVFTALYSPVPVNINEDIYVELNLPKAYLTNGFAKTTGVLVLSSWNYTCDSYSISDVALDPTGSYILEGKNHFYELVPSQIEITSGDTLSLELTQSPDDMVLTVYRGGNEYLKSHVSIPADMPVPEEQGLYTYEIKLTYDESPLKGPYHGNLCYRFQVLIENPVEYRFSHGEIQPGELFYVTIRYPEDFVDYSLTSDISDISYPFYDGDDVKVAIYPLSYTLTGRLCNFYIKDSTGNILAQTEVNIIDKDFPIQYLTVSSEIDSSTRNDEAYAEYDKVIGPVRKTNTPEKFWEGTFLKPVEGRITTEFGMRRFVNNAPTSYRHSGIDIAANMGTPIMATNSGRVILSRHLILIGNTVLIDHGYGMISWNYHMDTLGVELGDMVKKGDIIGTVGTTGFSTGPHLHFAISVHDIFTNPWTLFDAEPLTMD